MASHAPKRLMLLRLDLADAPRLGACYERQELEIATQGNFVWVKNITIEVIDKFILRAIPSLLILEVEAGILYQHGRQLPWGTLPELDWQPIRTALLVVLPDPNPNYLGLDHQLTPTLVRSTRPQSPTALRVSFSNLQNWIKGAAAWRLAALKWVVLSSDTAQEALLLGHPLPPIAGAAYWTCGRSLLPLGYALDGTAWPAILDQYIGADAWWLWDTAGHYLPLEAALFQPLSRSSWHQTIDSIPF